MFSDEKRAGVHFHIHGVLRKKSVGNGEKKKKRGEKSSKNYQGQV